ncbi:MAG: HAMP domain-containing sensor histidine kinase [Candidatus Gracilibacteria bacterium]|nr:HAMP domain-containing sensor histidine kinase [Candidatus Gracilibacteria bacterium]
MKKNKNDEFISIVGHELRTPLTSIRGYISMILEGDMGEISDEARKALNHCYDSSVRLVNLVNDVLALSKIESGKMEYYMKDIQITELLKLVYNDVFLEVESKKVDFEIQIDKHLKEKKINIDTDKIRQVFINLINNAVKFTDIGGKIILKVSKIKNNVKFEIIDNGIGIPKDKIDTIFEKFSQIESSLQRTNTTGLGIGLALCKNFIKDFGSEIKVKSEFGKGSNFSFELNLI